MNKNEFQLIADAVDTKNPKRELNYAYIDFHDNCIYATDTRKLVIIQLREDEIENCYGTHYLHRKILKAMITFMSKEKEINYKFVDNHLIVDDMKFKLDTEYVYDEKYKLKYPNMRENLPHRYSTSYTTEDLMYVDFDTTHNNTHINSDMFKGVQEYGDAVNYKVSSIPQNNSIEGKRVGMVKIEGFKENQLRFTTVLMGIEYKPQDPTLFDALGYYEEHDTSVENQVCKNTEDLDDLYEDAKQIVIDHQKTSISYIQRNLKIGYNRSARIVEQLEENGVLSSPNAKGNREILI